jgi:hypothetical protein
MKALKSGNPNIVLLVQICQCYFRFENHSLIKDLGAAVIYNSDHRLNSFSISIRFLCTSCTNVPLF